MIDLSLILPCYKDAPHLRASVVEIVRVLESIRCSWEIIFVNDASPDRDREVIRELLAEDSSGRLRFIDHEKNTGRGEAVRDGFLAARGEFCGFIDIDLEVPAIYMLSMLLALQQGADVACAHRIYKLRLGILHRAVLSRGYSFLTRLLLRNNMPDTEAGYKFFRRERVLPVLATCEDPGWFWDTEIMLRCQMAGLKIAFPPTLFLRRADKASTVRIAHDVVEYWRRLLRFRSMRRAGQIQVPDLTVPPPPLS